MQLKVGLSGGARDLPELQSIAGCPIYPAQACTCP